MIFPKFKNLYKIQEIRKVYDPLYQHVNPHITLVFPFSSTISTKELEDHIRNTIMNIRPFKLKLQGFSKEAGNYLFLNVIEGEMSLLQIHHKLYSDILREYYPIFLTVKEFKPHLTVGRTEEKLLDEAFEKCKLINEEFTDEVNEIAVEIIDENEDSRIELIIKLT